MKKVCVIMAAVAATAAFGAFAGCNSVAYVKYANADLYTVGGASFTVDKVKEVEVDWVGGSIEIAQSSSNTVEIVEDGGIENEEQKMRYYLDGNVLKIKYCQSGLRGNIKEQNKNLRVSLPAAASIEVESKTAVVTVGVIAVNGFSIETISGNFTAERIECNQAEFETVSGKMTVGELITTTLSAETTSGDISVSHLSADFMDVETTSGDLSFGLERAVKGEIESNSADVTLTLGKGLGAEIHLENASGAFRSDKQFNKVGARYDIFGQDGVSTDCKLEIDVFSGDVFIK